MSAHYEEHRYHHLHACVPDIKRVPYGGLLEAWGRFGREIKPHLGSGRVAKRLQPECVDPK